MFSAIYLFLIGPIGRWLVGGALVIGVGAYGVHLFHKWEEELREEGREEIRLEWKEARALFEKAQTKRTQDANNLVASLTRSKAIAESRSRGALDSLSEFIASHPEPAPRADDAGAATRGAVLNNCPTSITELAKRCDGHLIDKMKLLRQWPATSESPTSPLVPVQ